MTQSETQADRDMRLRHAALEHAQREADARIMRKRKHGATAEEYRAALLAKRPIDDELRAIEEANHWLGSCA